MENCLKLNKLGRMMRSKLLRNGAIHPQGRNSRRGAVGKGKGGFGQGLGASYFREDNRITLKELNQPIRGVMIIN